MKQPDVPHSVARTSRIQKVPINLMRVASVLITQRAFRPGRGRYLSANLELEKLGFPVINHRDRIFWILDGQHRIWALKTRGFENDVLDCEVYENLTDKEAAGIFLGRNNALSVAPFDKFKVACTAEDPRAIAIARAVESQGVKISREQSENCVSAVTSIGRVYDVAGGGDVGEIVLGQTIRTIKSAFAGDPAAFDGELMVGLGNVYNRYNGRTNEKELASRLAAVPHGVRGILRRANAQRERTGNQKAQCIAATIVDIYNKGVGSRSAPRLKPWWKTANDAQEV